MRLDRSVRNIQHRTFKCRASDATSALSNLNAHCGMFSLSDKNHIYTMGHCPIHQLQVNIIYYSSICLNTREQNDYWVPISRTEPTTSWTQRQAGMLTTWPWQSTTLSLKTQPKDYPPTTSYTFTDVLWFSLNARISNMMKEVKHE